MKTAKELAEWILDYPLYEQATLDEGTDDELWIIGKCREILTEQTTIGKLFGSKIVNGMKYREMNYMNEYKEMLVVLKDNSLLSATDEVDVNNLPPIVKTILANKEEEWIHHYEHIKTENKI